MTLAAESRRCGSRRGGLSVSQGTFPQANAQAQSPSAGPSETTAIPDQKLDAAAAVLIVRCSSMWRHGSIYRCIMKLPACTSL